MQRLNKSGFTIVETILALVIVALIGLVGYKIYNTQKENDKITNNTEAVLEQTPTQSNDVPQVINSANDLEQAEETLDSYNASSDDNKDLSDLEAQLLAF